jgi:hypothetical protein
LPKFCVKEVVANIIHLHEKGKDPNPYLDLMDPDPGGPKTSGSPTLVEKQNSQLVM